MIYLDGSMVKDILIQANVCKTWCQDFDSRPTETYPTTSSIQICQLCHVKLELNSKKVKLE